MPHNHNSQTFALQALGDLPRSLTLPRARTDSAHGYHWNRRLQHSGFWTHQAEIGAARQNQRSFMHDVLMRDVTVGENNFIHAKLTDELRQLFFRKNQNALRIICTCKLRRVDSALNSWYLRHRERHNAVVTIASEVHVIVVEIPACSAHNNYF